MYFISMDHVQKTATFHFDTISNIEELDCFKADVNGKFAMGWLEDDNGNRSFAHHDEADACLEFWLLDNYLDGDPNKRRVAKVIDNYTKLYCPQCFRKLERPVVDTHLEVNVVVYADGCVGPEVLVTLDEELARHRYLMWDRECTDEDLITWQQISIKQLEKKS